MAELKTLKPLLGLKPLVPIVPEPSTLGDSEGNPEEAALTDHQKMLKGLREQQAQANKTANDSGYWFAAYFQTSDQKDEFIKAMGLETGGQYVDGLQLAEACGVKLTPRTTPYKTGTLDRKCAALAR